ncbi:hypothetical protein N7478_000790 [Penicillium angulare]|uniref:uncharacterized protein n=1 Tax=Penicillium angulare TaxID=116970 RepID=UPI002540F08F|nr:uncharacterized protein N7478_000790 [Penicillium angulare]KAJ5291539.1 hypothetical protein N7478_000790 [Penicillium angulare]
MKPDLLNIIHSQTADAAEQQELPAGEPKATSPIVPTDTDSAAIKTVTTCQEPEPRVIKSRKKKIARKIHRRCLEVARQFDDEFEKAIKERDEQMHEDRKLIQRLRNENRKKASKLRQTVVERQKALAEKLILETEVRQLKQLLNRSRDSGDGCISWAAVQPTLYRVHDELRASLSQLWDTIDMVQR